MAMEKPAKPIKKLLKLLPKAAPAAITFQNPPFSPGRDKRSENPANKLKSHAGKGFSGPMKISIIPAEARRRNASKSTSDFESQEPTSPKISCIGQIKNKKKKKKKMMKDMTVINKTKPFSLPRDFKPAPSKPAASVKPNLIKSIFGGRGSKPSVRNSKSDASAEKLSKSKPDRAPTLAQMRRFASGRERLAGFDWTAQVAPEEGGHGQRLNYYSDEERGGDSDEEEPEVIIPFSAPLVLGGGGCGGGVALEPRKEINLWKRRTMTQPRPLQVNTPVRSR